MDSTEFFQRIGETLDRMSFGTGRFLRDMFGSRNRRVVHGLVPIVQRIAQLESTISALSPDDLKRKTIEFKEKLAQGASLDDILPEAFACVREAAKRSLGMRHFDVQMMGGIVLHRGQIAEMSTGEGKTLVATSPAYLNALLGKGVFVVTVNDYLAQRDRDWMTPVYQALGLNVGAIQSNMHDPALRKPHYAADITYGTNNEFGFDYLRDNMKSRADEQVQKHLQYAIVDEVDSILIDEARTPLIISGIPERSTDSYYRADQIARELRPELDFEIKEKEHQCILTEEGIEKAQKFLGVDSIYTGGNMEWPHNIETALRAHHLYKKDKEYVVKNDDDGHPGIVIVDEFTGRLMQGRRWSDGLHQAVEAKEGLRVREELQTLATITFQNYFRLYKKLAGMTGTAMTEASEFHRIYKLDVVQIPTNRPNIRKDHEDVVYMSEIEKYAALVREIVEVHKTGRPILVGTVSIEKSERVSGMLADPRVMTIYLAKHCEASLAELTKVVAKRPAWMPESLEARIRETLARPAFMDVAAARAVADEVMAAAEKEILAWRLDQVARYAMCVDEIKKGIPHSVLNAKFHEREAHIVAQAGRFGTVTIATNMAGRGTDILLGGSPAALARDEVGAAAPDDVYQAAFAKYKLQCDEEKQRIIALGGLHIVGSERHEARRIDNQLRGRTGRQGDPGSTRFFLSLQDDLMRIFARDWVTPMLKRLGMLEGQEIESRMVTRGIERAQKKVEQRNFEIRKNLLEYDEVMDQQRKTIYSLRQEILESLGDGGDGHELKDRVFEMCRGLVRRQMDTYLGESKKDWELQDFCHRMHQSFGVEIAPDQLTGIEREQVETRVMERITQAYDTREQAIGPPMMRQIERFLLLNVIDSKWKDHLHAMSQLRETVSLRGYAQVDPKNEYKREGFEHFQQLLHGVEDDVTNLIFRVQVVREEEQKKLDARWKSTGQSDGDASSEGAASEAPQQKPPAAPGTASEDEKRVAREQQRRDLAGRSAGRSRPARPIKREGPRVGRNDPCPCGSGEKYKKCCFPKFGE